MPPIAHAVPGPTQASACISLAQSCRNWGGVQIKRTEGVSSTDLVGRMLLCTRDSSKAVQQQVRPGSYPAERCRRQLLSQQPADCQALQRG